MVHSMVMKMVNIAEAKAQLSDLIDLVGGGELVVICKRNQPIAELHPVPGRRTAARPLGLSPGSATLRPAFFEPLPEAIVDDFDHPRGVAGGGTARDAEPRARYRPEATPRRRPRRRTSS